MNEILGRSYWAPTVFGTAALVVTEDAREIVRAYPLTAGEYWLGASERQSVNTLYRTLGMTSFQLVERFGRGAVSVGVRERYDRGEWDHMVEIVHAIEPNEEVRALDEAGGFGRSNRHMPFRSVWYEKSGANDNLLDVGGFEEFPALCPRWHLAGNDVYGRSPGMDALPDAKSLQRMQLRFAETLDSGMKIFDDVAAKVSDGVIPGVDAFRLYDTYGFPVDLTADMARERGMGVDMAGFDAAMEFPPHKLAKNCDPINDALDIVNPDYQGHVVHYQSIVDSAKAWPDKGFPLIRTVFPGWDNEARRPGKGYTFAYATPDRYQDWLEFAVGWAERHPVAGERIVIERFSLEGRGGALVERIDGCVSNVIGLSLPLLRRWLAG